MNFICAIVLEVKIIHMKILNTLRPKVTSLKQKPNVTAWNMFRIVLYYATYWRKPFTIRSENFTQFHKSFKKITSTKSVR